MPGAMAGDATIAGEEVDEDEDTLLEGGDPIAALIDRIESVKTSFEQFSKSLKDDDPLDEDEDDEDEVAVTSDAASDSAAADMDNKIARFESLLERLGDVVTRMEATEDLAFVDADAASTNAIDEDEDDGDKEAEICDVTSDGADGDDETKNACQTSAAAVSADVSFTDMYKAGVVPDFAQLDAPSAKPNAAAMASG